MQLLRQSTAATVVLGPFVDSTDGVTAETALTIAQADIRLSKNGGAFAQTNNAAGATHMENGYYSVPLDTTDTGTLGRLTVAVSESGALPVWREFQVVPANVYDSLVLGTDALQVDTVQVSGTVQTANDVGADVDAILVDTGTTLDGKLDTIDGNVDSILEDTGTTLPASIDALPTAAENADAVWDEAKAGHVTAGTFGEEVQAHALSTEISALNDFDPATEEVDVGKINGTTLGGAGTTGNEWGPA